LTISLTGVLIISVFLYFPSETHLAILHDQIDWFLSLSSEISLNDIVGTGRVSVLRIEGGTRDMGSHSISTAFYISFEMQP
jgi:hypothetical protein